MVCVNAHEWPHRARSSRGRRNTRVKRRREERIDSKREGGGDEQRGRRERKFGARILCRVSGEGIERGGSGILTPGGKCTRGKAEKRQGGGKSALSMAEQKTWSRPCRKNQCGDFADVALSGE